MALCSSNTSNKEARSVAFMPLILDTDAVDVDVEGPETAEDAEVMEAAGAAEEEETTTITTRMLLMESM
jgi:hypothetical protein